MDIFLYAFLFVSTVSAASNIALNREAEQSSVTLHNWTASRAVDGCLDQNVFNGCCTHTQPEQLEAWWRVDLVTMSAIDHINIYYRAKFEHRFAGYKLYVSNTTDRSQGILCYHDPSSSLAEVANIQRLDCPYVGQYVIIYNERTSPNQPDWYSDTAILELCEVQVIGCPVGTYGDGDCAMNCSSACLTNSCNSISGSCFYCNSGKYGDSCDEDCSSNCKDQICEKDTGHCLDCAAGSYGNDCQLDCPVNCDGKICKIDTGNCFACNHGFYGDMCDKNCPDTCEDPICDFKSGTCGDCKLGYYGFRCNSTCNSNCKGNECRQTDGACEEGCQDGTYGLVCDQDCSINCKSNICHRLNGTCLECHDGQYGDICELSCPHNCERNICERNCGVCGECMSGKYGFYCEKACPEECGGKSCSRTDGTCATDYTSCTAYISVLGCTTGLFFLGMVSLIIMNLRLRTEIRAGKQREPPYANLGPAGRDTQHVYETTTT